MKKLFQLPIKIKNGPLKGKVYNVDVPVDVSEKDLAKINIDGGFLAGSSFLAILSSIAAAGGAGGAAVATAGAVTVTVGVISAAVGVVGAVVALGVFVPAIVNMVREANTTSMVLLNTVPNSTMRITKVVKEKGAWVDTDEAAIKRDHADVNEREAAALMFRSQPYRSGGLVKGHFEVELTFTKTGAKEHFNIYWDNPLGPDGPYRKAKYSTNLPTTANGSKLLYSPSPQVDHPSVTRPAGRKHEKTRADIVTYVIGPSAKGMDHIA